MLVYTFQKKEAVEKLIKTGILYSEKEFAMFYNNNRIDQEWKKAYDFIRSRLYRKINEKINETIYPIWVWKEKPDQRKFLFKNSFQGRILLEIEIAEEHILFFDYNAWHIALNGSYMEDIDEINGVEIETSWDKILDLNYLRNHEEWYLNSNCEITLQGVIKDIKIAQVIRIKDENKRWKNLSNFRNKNSNS